MIDRAREAGAEVTDISHLIQKDAALLEYNDVSELILEGVPSSWINERSKFYCDNKQLAKKAFQKLGIPFLKSIAFTDPNAPEVLDFVENGQKYVVKPIDNCNGLGVETNIVGIDMVKDYFHRNHALDSLFLLEEQAEGQDLRLHVIDGKVVAACIREPAFVVGDGERTLEALIDERRAIMRTQNPRNKLEIDGPTQQLLTEQKLQLSDVPKKDRKVVLKYVSNMGQGGRAIDVTDAIHPVFHDWAASLCKYLEVDYMGIDFMTTDFVNEPEQHTIILEVNAYAEWLHHTFSEGRTHDVAGMILGALFDR